MNKVLRPHHGMCFQFYEGKGYSEDFTDHMGKVIHDMENNPTQKIILSTETDVVCTNCPNNQSGVCTTQEKVVKYDCRVLRECGIEDGTEISFADFIEQVKEKIIDLGHRNSICGDCSWDYICREKEQL